MQGYLRKILLLFVAVYSLFNLSYGPAVIYTMSNSPAQMRFFALVGFACCMLVFPAGLILAYLQAKPVQDGLLRAFDDSLHPQQLLSLARRNIRIPFLLGTQMLALMVGSVLLLFVIYQAYGAGPVGMYGMFLVIITGVLVVPLSMYCVLYFVVAPANDHFYKACQTRGIEFFKKDKGLRAKIFVPILMLCVATMTWMLMGSFYEGIYRLREEASGNILASQNYALRDLVMKKGETLHVADIKPIIDGIETCGLGPSFLCTTQGQMLYNPQNIPIFNARWQDINENIRKGFASGKPGSIFENVHEQLICYTPLPGGMVMGTVVGIAGRLPRFNQFWVVSLIMSIIVIFVVVGVGASLVSMIIKPIIRTKDSILDLSAGEGDLTARLDVLSNDESGVMAMGLNEFMEKLDGIIDQVKNTAYAVSSANQEVTAGSQGLSQSTQEQASAVEEAAATIEEMTSSIKNNAGNASEGRQKVSTMVKMAEESGKSSKELENSMSSILAASKKIEDIIVTVNEVAFQTNLLALNAAVEAARAGEHGKGFAVVAEEVRALAGRSAAAVREIKTLIEDTVEKINAGDAVVKKTGTAFNEIIAQILELSQTMDEIAAASGEQAVGVDEVNRAIAQIDSSTQSNVSTVDQLAANAENMTREAQSLIRVVDRFKVSNHDHADKRTKRKME